MVLSSSRKKPAADVYDIEMLLQGGRWETICADFLTPEQVKALRRLPEGELLSETLLCMGIGTTAAKKVLARSGVKAEIRRDGARRCVITKNGERCDTYVTPDHAAYVNRQVVCKKHTKVAMNLTSFFTSERLKDAYEAFRTDPAKMQADGELAMMRLMLSQLVERMSDDRVISMDQIAAITTLCEKITQTIERISKVEKLTPENMERIIGEIVKLSASYVPPEKLAEFAQKVEEIEYSDTVISATPMLPTKTITVEKKDVQVQRRAMLDVANHLGISTEGHTL